MTVLDYQITDTTDDGSWTGTSWANDYVTMNFGADDVPVKAFCRFPAVTIPTSAVIVSAYVSFYQLSYQGVPPTCTLYFEKAANPNAISSATDGNNRVKTSASISIPGHYGGNWWNTSSITSIIAELRASYNYSSGAAMQVIVIGSGSGTNNFRQCTVDYSESIAPKLHIEYLSVGGIDMFGKGLCGASPLISTHSIVRRTT